MSAWNRCRCILFVICALLAAGSLKLHAATDVPGDINQDGSLTVSDYGLLQCYVLGNGTLTAEQLAAADVAPLNSPDGTLDEDDLLLLESAIMGRVSLPLTPSETTLPTLVGFIAPPPSGDVLTESLSGYQMALGQTFTYDIPNAVTIPNHTTPTDVSGQVPPIKYGGFARNILLLGVQDFTNNPGNGTGQGRRKPDLAWGAWMGGAGAAGAWAGVVKSVAPVSYDEALKASAGDIDLDSAEPPVGAHVITTDPAKVTGIHPVAMTLVLEPGEYHPIRVLFDGDPSVDIQYNNTDFRSFEFTSDAKGIAGTFYSEATDFYGSFLIDTGPVVLSDTEINDYAQWCLANWTQGNYYLPPQLQQDLYLMMDTFEAPDKELPGSALGDFMRKPIIGPDMTYEEEANMPQTFRISNNALRADAVGASGWGTRQSRTGSVFHTIEARYRNYYHSGVSLPNGCSSAQPAAKLVIRENDENWADGGIAIILSATSSNGTDLHLCMEARHSPGEQRSPGIQGAERKLIGRLLDPSAPFDVLIQDDGNSIRAGVKGAVFDDGAGQPMMGEFLTFNSTHAASTANGSFWHDFAGILNKLELQQIIVWND